MSKFTISDFKGVIPASLSIFDINENLDIEATKEFTEFLLSFGISGLYLTGSTGEGFLMKSEERMETVKAVMEVAGDKVPVVVHVGNIGTKRTIELAKQAKEAGAKLIVITRHKKSTLSKMCDIVLLCGGNEGPLQGGSMAV